MDKEQFQVLIDVIINMRMEIVEKLEAIRCGLIDIEVLVEKESGK